VFRSRIRPVLDRKHIGLHCSERRIVIFLKVLHEFRCASSRNIEHVVKHENLAINVRSGADAYDGNIQFPGRRLPDFIWNTLEQHDIGTCILQALCGIDHLARLIRLPALHLEATDFVHRLWLETQMSADGNVMAGKVPDNLDLTCTAFELDHHRATFLHQAHRVVECLTRVGIAHERHVGNEEGVPQAASDGPRVIDNIVDSYRYRRIVTLNHHAERVANEHEVRAGGIDQRCVTRIVSRQASDRLTILFHFSQCRDIDRRLGHTPLFELCIHKFARYQANAAATGLKKCRPPVVLSIC